MRDRRVSMVIYVVGLNVAAVGIAGRGYSGLKVVVYGVMAVIERPLIAIGLAANPLLYLAWVLAVVSFGDLAAAMAFVAPALALSSTFVGDTLSGLGPVGAGPIHLETEFYLWIASIALSLAGSVFMLLCGLTSSRWVRAGRTITSVEGRPLDCLSSGFLGHLAA